MGVATILMSPADSNIYKFFGGLYNVISTEKLSHLISFEQHHADMQALNINGQLFINENSVNVIHELKKRNTNFTVCENIGGKYPDNIALNCALIGDRLLCKKSALHPKVRLYCEQSGIKIINVNQGYTKCSTLILDDSSIITDDNSIEKAALVNNINVLKIDRSDIYLDNNNIGFIGGCSAKIDDTIYFFGDINKHTNAEIIKDYIHKRGLKIKSIGNNMLYDIGGAIIIE